VPVGWQSGRFSDLRSGRESQRLQIPTSARQRQDVSSRSPATKATDSLNEVESAGPEYALKLPANSNRHTGDWDEIRRAVFSGCLCSTTKQDSDQETVQYVANVYKYYVAYKMAIAQQQVREAANNGIAKR
jgi:hypothetical protein